MDRWQVNVVIRLDGSITKKIEKKQQQKKLPHVILEVILHLIMNFLLHNVSIHLNFVLSNSVDKSIY